MFWGRKTRAEETLSGDVRFDHKDQALLVRVLFMLAKTHLTPEGVIPCGATLRNGEVKVLVPKSASPAVSYEKIESYWRKVMKDEISAGCSSACHCLSVKKQPGHNLHSPALVMHFENAQGWAEDVYFPYEVGADSEFVFGEPVRQKQECHLFNELSDSR